MKKILLVSSVLVFCLFAVNSASAQVVAQNTSSGGVVVATVNIYNAKIVSQDGRNFALSFELSNESGVQPQVEYSVRLTENSSSGETLVDEKVYDKTISLDQKTTINQTINYSVPNALPAGTYGIWIMSRNESGLPLAIAYVGDVKIAASVAGTVEIIPDSCYLTAGTSTQKYSLSQGILISDSDKIIETCKIASNLSKGAVLTPKFETRSNSVFGTDVAQSGGATGTIEIKNGANDISLALPKATAPGNYVSILSLASSVGQITSNEVTANYTIKGLSGTIQNVILDKTFYKAGDMANLQIFRTLSGIVSTTTITTSITDGQGNACSNSAEVQIPSNILITNMQIPIAKDCANPKANITLSANGTILDSKDFQITTPANLLPKPAINANNLIIIIIIVLILLMIIFRKKKQPAVSALIFIFLLASALFGFSKNVSANTVSFGFSSNDPSIGCGNYCYVNIVTGLDKSSYTPSGNMIASNFSASNILVNITVQGYIDSGSHSTIASLTYFSSGGQTSVKNFTAPASAGSHNFNVYNYFCQVVPIFGSCISGTGGSKTQAIPFTVSAPLTISISANPSIVTSGGQTTITYSGSNTSAYTLSSNPDMVALSKTVKVANTDLNNVATVLQSANNLNGNPFNYTVPVNISQTTTFTLSATGTDGVTTASTSTIVNVAGKSCADCANGTGFQAPANVYATTTCSNMQPIITWTNLDSNVEDYIYRGATLIATITGNSYQDNAVALSNGKQYSYTIQEYDAGAASTSPMSAASSFTYSSCPKAQQPITSSTDCSASQAGSPIIYVNKAMTWTMENLDPKFIVSSTIWSGTDLPSAGITTNGTSLSKIYTTVGSKTINATTTGTIDGSSTYTATCSTTVKLKQGIIQEI